jgi:hypothetical protein
MGGGGGLILCSPAMKTMVAGLSLIVAISAAGAARSSDADPWTSRPAVPAALAVPETAKLAAHLHAVGAQVYVCAAAPDTKSYAWTLKRPDATLYDQKGAPAGSHGAGPIWIAKDGSSVTGKKVAQVDALAGDAIPWLLLRAEKTSGAGLFSKITYVQRVATNQGKPPSTKCDAGAAGTETRAHYSADYYFYTN